MQFQATVCWKLEKLPLLALVDSGADENFMDIILVSQADITTKPLTTPLDANAVDGRLLARVTHQTCPVQLIISGHHREQILFHLISSPHAPIILGQPWLRLHNPHLDWSAGKVISWSPYCDSICFQSALSPLEGTISPSVRETPDLSNIPSLY